MARPIKRAVLMIMSNIESHVETHAIKVTIELQSASYQVNMASSWSLAIPVNFNQPSFAHSRIYDDLN